MFLGKINVQATHSFNEEQFSPNKSLAFLLMHSVLVYLVNIKSVSYTDITCKDKWELLSARLSSQLHFSLQKTKSFISKGMHPWHFWATLLALHKSGCCDKYPQENAAFLEHWLYAVFKNIATFSNDTLVKEHLHLPKGPDCQSSPKYKWPGGELEYITDMTWPWPAGALPGHEGLCQALPGTWSRKTNLSALGAGKPTSQPLQHPSAYPGPAQTF